MIRQQRMVERDQKTEQAQRQDVNPNSRVAQEDTCGKDEDERVHHDPLVPAEHAGQELQDLAKIEAPRGRHERLRPSNIPTGRAHDTRPTGSAHDAAGRLRPLDAVVCLVFAGHPCHSPSHPTRPPAPGQRPTPPLANWGEKGRHEYLRTRLPRPLLGSTRPICFSHGRAAVRVPVSRRGGTGTTPSSSAGRTGVPVAPPPSTRRTGRAGCRRGSPRSGR